MDKVLLLRSHDLKWDRLIWSWFGGVRMTWLKIVQTWCLRPGEVYFGAVAKPLARADCESWTYKYFYLVWILWNVLVSVFKVLHWSLNFILSDWSVLSTEVQSKIVFDKHFKMKKVNIAVKDDVDVNIDWSPGVSGRGSWISDGTQTVQIVCKIWTVISVQCSVDWFLQSYPQRD